MSVIGIDLGNENCYVATIRSGGVEVLTNDTGQRATPAYIGFGDRNRTFGVTAKSQHVTNVNNTVFGCKRLIGRLPSDELGQHELTYLPYYVCVLSDGFYGIKVIYKHQEVVFSVQQVIAMLLVKLKDFAETALGTQVEHCVISVPVYFPDSTRRAILDAGRIAGLNVLRLLNDTTAVALSYGFYKESLSETKSSIVIFVDMGHSAFQVSACCMIKGQLNVLATIADPELGGRDFDNVIVRYFSNEFRTKYKLDVLSNTRATIRLISECEKLKKQLSANPQVLPLNIECFMEDKDVSGKLGRDQFEAMCGDLLGKAEFIMKKLLSETNLKSSDINAVELVGGSARIPAVKSLIHKVFGIEPSTTLNLDEAVAKGCVLHCAMLSPTLKVREYLLSDVQPYPIKLIWNLSKGEKGEVEVFPLNHKIPFSKYMTFYPTEPFTLNAHYGTVNYKPSLHNLIGSFTINDISRPFSGESAKVRLKIRVNIDGIFSISSAILLGKDESDSALPDQKLEDEMDITEKINEFELSLKSQENEKSVGFFQKKLKKIREKPVDLTIVTKVPQLSSNDLSTYIRSEAHMRETDISEKERVDTKNCLEEYIYEMRDALGNDLDKFVEKRECDQFKNKLEQIENWLYEDGELQTKSAFAKTLRELKEIGDPLVFRKNEYTLRQCAVDDFKSTISRAQQLLDSHASKDPEISSLPPGDIEKIRKVLKDKSEWFKKQLFLLSQAQLHQNPPISSKQIIEERENLERDMKSILNKSRN